MSRMLFVLCAFASFLALPARADPQAWKQEGWTKTDFSRTRIKWEEILSGGPAKDGIPSIDKPLFKLVADEHQLAPNEPVIGVEIAGDARAYPLRILIWHEIVNDTVAGMPIAVTFCPLCNTGMIFDRRTGGKTLSFGVSGLLRNSDMIMYDRETLSWWQQALGEGIVGHHAGDRLIQQVAWMESWEAFRAAHPEGLVMDEPDWRRAYGQNPYVSYDSSITPFLYDGAPPPHGIAPLARVLRVGNRAWPLERLRRAGTLTEAGLTITWAEGQASALDSAASVRGARWVTFACATAPDAMWCMTSPSPLPFTPSSPKANGCWETEWF